MSLAGPGERDKHSRDRTVVVARTLLFSSGRAGVWRLVAAWWHDGSLQELNALNRRVRILSFVSKFSSPTARPDLYTTTRRRVAPSQTRASLLVLDQYPFYTRVLLVYPMSL